MGIEDEYPSKGGGDSYLPDPQTNNSGPSLDENSVSAPPLQSYSQTNFFGDQLPYNPSSIPLNDSNNNSSNSHTFVSQVYNEEIASAPSLPPPEQPNQSLPPVVVVQSPIVYPIKEPVVPDVGYVPLAVPLPVIPALPLTLYNDIFIGTNGRVRALELSGDGKTITNSNLWTSKLMVSGRLVHTYLNRAKGHIYALSKGYICCLNALDGHEVWRTVADFRVLTQPELCTLLVSFDGNVLIAAAAMAVVAFNAATGEHLWTHRVDLLTTGAFSLLEFKGMLFVGVAGIVLALNMKNGSVIWKNSLSGFGIGPVSVAAYSYDNQDIIFVASHGFILSWDALSGHTRHHIALNSTSDLPMTLRLDATGDLLFAAIHGELHCFSAHDLERKWKSNLPGMGYSIDHSLLLAKDHVYIGMKGKIAALENLKGKLIWKTELPDCGYTTVVVGSTRDCSVLICGSAGKLYGVKSEDGSLVWQDSLKGLGYAPVIMSTTASNTDFNSTTVLHYVQKTTATK